MAGGLLKDIFKISNDFFDPLTNLERRERDSHTSANRHLRPSFRMPSNQGGSTNIFAGVPRPKFLFGARFFRKLGGINSRTYGTDEGKADTAFMLKYLDRPKINFDVEELNQYNKKRLVHTGVKYQPLAMRFHDAVDDRVLMMFQDYFSFYFGDGRKATVDEWANDNVKEQFLDFGSGWGFAPYDELNGNQQHFFSHIDIYHFFGGMYNTMTLVHPRIELFDHDSNDFAEGTTGAEIQMTLKYEGIIYSRQQFPITANDAKLFGISKEQSDYLEIGNLSSGAINGIGDLGNIRTRFLDAAGVPTQLRRFVPNLPTPIQGVLNKVSGVNSALGTIGRYAHAAAEGAARASQGTRTDSNSSNPNDSSSRATAAATGGSNTPPPPPPQS